MSLYGNKTFMLYPLFILYSLSLISTMCILLIKHLLAHCCTEPVNGGTKTWQKHLEMLLDIQKYGILDKLPIKYRSWNQDIMSLTSYAKRSECFILREWEPWKFVRPGSNLINYDQLLKNIKKVI